MGKKGSSANKTIVVDYPAAVRQAMICFESGVTPMFEGHSGIGKSALATAIEEEAKALFEETKGRRGYDRVETVVIFGSLLKEGELGGIPESVEAKNLGLDMMGETIRVNRYTVYEKIHDVLRLSKEVGETGRVILFVDELNRCDPATQGELMQLVLDRRVQNIILPENVYIMAAINPDDMDSEGLDYGVTTMNEALVPRFALYGLKVDPNQWLKYAARPRANVHPDIIEFIADNTKLLHDPHADGRIKPMPRSWSQFSRMYNTILGVTSGPEARGEIYTACSAKLGDVIAQSFTSWLDNRRNPLIKPEELLQIGEEGQEARDQATLERLRREPLPRLHITLSNMAKYMEANAEKKWKPEWVRAFRMTLDGVNSTDTIYAFFADMMRDYPKMADKMKREREFATWLAKRLTRARSTN